jgi:hypothetical protein
MIHHQDTKARIRCSDRPEIRGQKPERRIGHGFYHQGTKSPRVETGTPEPWNPRTPDSCRQDTKAPTGPERGGFTTKTQSHKENPEEESLPPRHQGTKRTRTCDEEGDVDSQNDTPDPIPDYRDIEIHQQSDSNTGQFEVSKKLGFEHRVDLVNRLYLNYHGIPDHHIQT